MRVMPTRHLLQVPSVAATDHSNLRGWEGGEESGGRGEGGGDLKYGLGRMQSNVEQEMGGGGRGAQSLNSRHRRRVHAVEPRVLQRPDRRHPLVRVVRHQLRKQVHAPRIHARHHVRQLLALPPREHRLVVRQRRHARPRRLVRRAQHTEDPEQLVHLAVAREQRRAVRHLAHDHTAAPRVHHSRVAALAQQDLGRTVPQRHNLVRVRRHRELERARKTEVRDLQDAVHDEQVLRLQVAVHDPVRVAEHKTLQHLVHERHQLLPLDRHLRLVHHLLQVAVAELEDEHQLRARAHHVQQVHNVLVVQRLQHGDLTQGGRRHPLVLRVQLDLLQRHHLARRRVARLVHHAVRALSELLHHRVLAGGLHGCGRCV
eukprot:Rhum_TRINITY_DN14800_c5_g1::Rhum_TRINITY_DN14800_c5_g1_i2::g.121182::m.121182